MYFKKTDILSCNLNMEQEEDNNCTVKSLTRELDEFRRKKEKSRSQIGHISGKSSEKKDAVINVIFILAVATLFLLI